MTTPYPRQDISARVWDLLEPHLPGGPGEKGRPCSDNCLFLKSVVWDLRNGTSWRDRRVWKDILDTVLMSRTLSAAGLLVDG